MANLNAPSGLSPVFNMYTSTYSAQTRRYYIPSTDTNAYAIGDPVGTLTGGADSNGVSAVTLGVAGSSAVLRGVITAMGGLAEGGPGGDLANLSLMAIPATKTKGYYVQVIDDPMVVFEVQEWGGTSYTAFTAADVGKGCNLKSGANNGSVSGWVLDTTAASATSSTRQVRLLGLARRGDNVFGQYARWLVLINQHELKAATAGV